MNQPDNALTVVNTICNKQIDFLADVDIQHRKTRGQFFTTSNVADYMASLISPPNKQTIKLLDAGAGLGILTVAAALKCLRDGILEVNAVLYEIDDKATEYLAINMEFLKQEFIKHGANFTYQIIQDDFVLTRPDRNFSSSFDLAIINPPYFKYSVKSSPYAKAASDLYKGDPNIYASFMAIACNCLKKEGELISITPRSFTNGLYFKGFRYYLLQASCLNLIHVFKYRNRVFSDTTANVLQENVICKFTKGKIATHIEIRSSDCDKDIFNSNTNNYPVSFIIDQTGGQNIIRIPESKNDALVMQQAALLKCTFENSGFFISTGPVVEHRTRDYIKEGKGEQSSIPLYRQHNVSPFVTNITFEHKKDASFYLRNGHEKHTLKNKNHVLLKRFSSKDEKKRLVASIHFARNHTSKFVAFGNKLNYVGIKDSELTEQESFGLVAVFNSTFFDKYFRCISGNTQVNATEIRTMKFPNKEEVKAIGEQVVKLPSINNDEIDNIVEAVLNLKNSFMG